MPSAKGANQNSLGQRPRETQHEGSRAMARLHRKVACARLLGHNLPQFGRRSLVCWRRCWSRAYRDYIAASFFPVGVARGNQETVFKMDQGPRDSLSGLFLATRLRGFFGKPESARGGERICGETRGTSPYSHFRKNIANCCANTVSSLTKSICGSDWNRAFESRLQR